MLGIPGKSNAFEISQKLGLSKNILDDATTHLKEDKISMEELLKNIYEDKLTIEKEKEEIEKNLNQIATLRQSLEQEKYELISKKKALLDKAKSDARDIVLDAKEEVNSILQLLNQEQANMKFANQSRDKLNQKIKELAPTDTLLENATDNLDAHELKEGLTVWIPSLQNSGTIVSTHVNKSNEVLVQVGLLKMNLKLEQLSKMQNRASNVTDSMAHSTVRTSMHSKSQTVSPEINVIGQNVDEAVYVIDKYIDNCALAHISPIRIVHGKGTGKLREGVHKYLKTNSHVKSFRLGTFGEGEMGVTVVELK